MVQALLFDFWGTLVENGVWSPSKQLQTILNIRLPFSEYILRMERTLMTAPFPSLRDAFLAVGKEFGVDVGEEQLEQLIGLWNKNWMLAQPYPETVEVLSHLRQKYLLCLVSNADCLGLEKVLEKYHLRQFFQQEFLSYKERILKSDQEFWARILQKLQLPPKECAMIGDSIESDIVPARTAGVHTILIDRKNIRPFAPKIISLLDLEKVLP